MLFQHGESSIIGVAILITNKTQFGVNTIDRNEHGRFLLICFFYFGFRCIVVNNYVPTILKRTEQAEFRPFVFCKLQNFLGHNIIVGGNFFFFFFFFFFALIYFIYSFAK